MTYYKWMLDGLTTPVQRKPWPVEVGEWTPKEPTGLCESGWHGVEEKDVFEHLPSRIGAQLWVVEVKGKLLKGDDKFCAPQMKLVRLIGTTTEENLRLFACDVSEDVLPLFEAKFPDDKRPRQAIEVARRFARGEATRDELNEAYWATDSAAYWAAYSAAYSAARSAADSAAYSAAYSAARSAADSAADSAAYSVADSAAYWAAYLAARSAARSRYSNWLVVRLESGE